MRKMAGKKVALIIGSSRGIGRQVAIDLAKNGYNGNYICTPLYSIIAIADQMWYLVVVAAKSTSDASKVQPFPPDPNSQSSTINTVQREITEAGGEAAAFAVDVRDYSSIERLVEQTVLVRQSYLRDTYCKGWMLPSRNTVI